MSSKFETSDQKEKRKMFPLARPSGKNTKNSLFVKNMQFWEINGLK